MYIVWIARMVTASTAARNKNKQLTANNQPNEHIFFGWHFTSLDPQIIPDERTIVRAEWACCRTIRTSYSQTESQSPFPFALLPRYACRSSRLCLLDWT